MYSQLFLHFFSEIAIIICRELFQFISINSTDELIVICKRKWTWVVCTYCLRSLTIYVLHHSVFPLHTTFWCESSPQFYKRGPWCLKGFDMEILALKRFFVTSVFHRPQQCCGESLSNMWVGVHWKELIRGSFPGSDEPWTLVTLWRSELMELTKKKKRWLLKHVEEVISTSVTFPSRTVKKVTLWKSGWQCVKWRKQARLLPTDLSGKNLSQVLNKQVYGLIFMLLS